MRVKIAAGCAIAATVLMAGCTDHGTAEHTATGHKSGSTATVDSGGNFVLASYSTTTRTGTARIVETNSTQFPGLKKPLEQKLQGVVDFDNRSGELSSDFGGLKMTNVFIGNNLYVKIPKDFAKVYGASTPWITYQLDAVIPGAGASQSQSSTPSPLQALTSLQGATDTIEKLGTETVGGVRTTHYRASVNVEAAAKKAGVFAKDLKDLADRIEGKTIPCEIWVDAQDRIRRQTSTSRIQDTGLDGKPATIISRQTLELSGFGTDVSVAAPPADQVTDVTAKMRELQRS